MSKVKPAKAEREQRRLERRFKSLMSKVKQTTKNLMKRKHYMLCFKSLMSKVKREMLKLKK